MKRTVSAALAAMCCLLFLGGCGTIKTSWRDTKKLYREYINTDPTIDFSAQGITDKGLQRLAALMMPVDERLMAMLRGLGSQDTPPENEWCQQFLTNHAWLSAVSVLDASGAVLFQAPAVSMRPLDFAGLVDFGDRYKVRKMGAQVKTDEFGTVVMVAAPYFKNNEWAGLVVASFDPRNLAKFSPEPDALSILSTEGVVWAGGGQGEALAGLKWDELLKDSVNGEITSGGGEYLWQARYVGQLEFIYVTDARDARATKPEPAPNAASSDEKAAPKADAPEAATPDAATPQTPAPEASHGVPMNGSPANP
ncbi:conserved hypothetical protein [Solidesulfovibrio fructosivorans JJ]]|uniref:Lipoprotein n=1 Tax=Solidesulfovibrio fructosivorans JJ] TaxID=596151 RepID=E1JRM3_SOLFR|nr:hypothetical protein [Solidesulfovibrio fructosivorans]EFL53224.1 conserved hypothetical protein [Solidesulfovibrio fructosivorans JJ]]